jgi:epoxyqueuosine reductase
LKETIRQRARALGFDACRFTTADPPDSAPHLQRWLEAGHHGDMQYLSRNARKRMDPREVLPGARTVISLAVSYASGPEAQLQGVPGHGRGSDSPAGLGPKALAPVTDAAPPPARPFRGVVARYAQFTDYHAVLGRPLQSLAAFVDQLGGPGVRSLWYVDTGPILERDLAQRAGVGFIGKHTNLISRSLGNWFFLAEIITTLALEPDKPERNHCGNCTRCLTACPTGAIVAPFQLDARRCISYLTIELRGPIPSELRPAIGGRVFGCDDCLAVCPWNRFAGEGHLLRPHARADLATPDLLELLALDDAGFRARFAGTPLLRAQRAGLLRNACVALGNIGDASCLPALQRAASSAEALIAEHARWAIEQIQKRGAGQRQRPKATAVEIG